MIAPDLETGIRHLRELVEQATVVVPFTGAGISTECGIPDFRSPGGIWTKMKPIDFGDFLASREARDESWRRRFVMDEQFGTAKPGRGHLALAALYRQGKVPAVVTQNIDNLHKAIPAHSGDWYFTGNYPTPGGMNVANRSYLNYMDGKLVRAY